MTVYEFGPFRLDVVKRRLLREGRVIQLTAKNFDILLLLVRNVGQVITKEELLREIWPGSFVEESNITVNVSALRKALGEDRLEREYIKTISKRGYCFVAGVKEILGGINSIAVLPLENLSGNPEVEYLSDGIAESIINSLSKASGLRVMARSTVFRYKGRAADVQQVGREMQVDAVLAGRMLLTDERLIISIELVDVADGSLIWGEQYDGRLSEALAVQAEITKDISSKLRLRLTAEERYQIGKRYTDKVEAYHLYLKGRYFWNKRSEEGLTKGITCFKRAIEIDPNYALAYAGLADAHYGLSNMYLSPQKAMSEARAAVLRAVEIDGTLAEAYAVLGMIKIYYDWDLSRGGEMLRRAIELNPGYATAHHRYGLYFTMQGRFEDAQSEFILAQQLDPLSLPINLCLALPYYYTGRYDEAVEQLEKTLELDPTYYMAYGLLALVLERKKEYPAAIAMIKRARQLDKNPELLRVLGHIYAVSGERDLALKVIRELKELSMQCYVSPLNLAFIYAGLGEHDEAFLWLEQAYSDRSEGLFTLKVVPEIEGLRADPRFTDLLRRIGLLP